VYISTKCTLPKYYSVYTDCADFWLFAAAIGKECEKYMKQGALVPDQIMEDMIITEMKKMQKDAWLLDGKLIICLLYFCPI